MFARIIFDLPALRSLAARFLRLRLHHALIVLRWSAILVPMALTVGSFCALFLWGLDQVTRQRFEQPWLLYGLPLAGLACGLLYHHLGRAAEGGNNLIVDQIHEPGGGVPLRMAPLVLLTTLITHLFGGSAGREGTAVQIGGSLASGFGRLFRLSKADTRILLMAGIAAGFGAVFGTPVAGAVFALEVLTVGRVQYEALIPCLAAALLGDWTCTAWGIHHTAYPTIEAMGHLDPVLLAKVAIAGVGCGLVSLLFAEAQHGASALFKRLVPVAPLRPVLGGLLVIALVHTLGTRDYLGLGVWSPNPGDLTIPGFFVASEQHWAWLLKLLFTVVTLSTGFKGGEVTPLFFIGAAFGNMLAWLLGAPVELFAAIGFVAVFAGAANTPLACTLMGVELFGGGPAIYIATACFLSYLASGHSGIYLSQRLGVPKTGGAHLQPDMALRHVRVATPAPIPLRLRPRRPPPSQPEVTAMPPSHSLSSSEVGMIRIYMKPRDRGPKGAGRGLFGGPPLYRLLVQAAKTHGIINAVAHRTHYGYSNHGKMQDEGVEIENPDLTMCVELIGPRQALADFCRQHGELLHNKIIIYKHLEHWSVSQDGLSRQEITSTLPDPHAKARS